MAKYVSAHMRNSDASKPSWGYGSIASFNRWTRRPHEHTREVARRTMSIADRRAAGYNDRPR